MYHVYRSVYMESRWMNGSRLGRCVVRLEVLFGLVRVGLDSVRSGLPRGGASLSHMAISPLEGLLIHAFRMDGIHV